MVGDSAVKEVRFDKWCSSCKYSDVDPSENDVSKTIEPCDSCLEVGMRIGTEKPEQWMPE